MTLGEKLRQARQEANLSQRALCGGEITRNMLSRIENGAAQPSMKTLRYLADRLGKPMSFFLDEQTVVSANQEVMESARRFYDAGQYAQALETLGGYCGPDPVCDREKALLTVLTRLALAEQAILQHRDRYARELLEALPNARIILTGVGEEDTGLLLRDCGEVKRYAHPRLPGSFSGTGDLFAAAFTGALAAEKGLYESAKIAADFTCRCIECTIARPAHWYGVKFEPVLPELMRMLGIKNKNYPLSF